MITIELTGIPQLMQRLQQLARPPTHVLGDAVHRYGNDIMTRSQRLVPV